MIAFCYCIGLQLLWVYEIEHTWIGIFKELLSIPILSMVPVLLYFSINNWKKNKWKIEAFTLLTIGILISTLALIVGWSV